MALRNAFANLITESVAGAVEAALIRMDERDARRGLMEAPRSLQYARTINDAMRVNIENTGYQVVLHPRNDGTNGTNQQHTNWFGAGSVFMVDEREQMRIQSESNMNNVRTNRWVFS